MSRMEKSGTLPFLYFSLFPTSEHCENPVESDKRKVAQATELYLLSKMKMLNKTVSD